MSEQRSCLDTVQPVDEDVSSPVPSATVTVYPDGPLLLRGDVRVVAPDGSTIPNGRRTVALCRCGKSAIKPWCDGTHKVARFSAPPPDGSA